MSRIDESINKMNVLIKQLEIKTLNVSDNLDLEDKIKVQQIANRTIYTIKNSISKLNDLKSNVTDENELEEFLTRLEGKCNDVVNYTLNKIDEVKPIIKETANNIKTDLEKDFENFEKEYEELTNNTDVDEKKQENTNIDKVFDNQYVKNAIKLATAIKLKAIKFYNDPKTQKAINEAKLETVKIIEKGLDELKNSIKKSDH